MTDIFIRELKISLEDYNCDVTYENDKFIITHTYKNDRALKLWMNQIIKEKECEDIGRIITSYLSPEYFIIKSKFPKSKLGFNLH
jgi:hypothetical protein